jgi:hypothetical protein
MSTDDNNRSENTNRDRDRDRDRDTGMSGATGAGRNNGSSPSSLMSPRTAVQVYRALQKVARQRGRATEEVLTLYGLERVLARLQRTPYAGDFVLKGGVLLAAYALRRPTRDADMQAVNFPLDEQHLREVLEAIAEVDDDSFAQVSGGVFDTGSDGVLDQKTSASAASASDGSASESLVGDGLVIDPTSITITPIRDEDQYGGLRARFSARLHTARLGLALDVSTGDPINPPPQPVVLPGLLTPLGITGQDVTLLGYPPASVVAEKAVTILQRGTQSTRWRDYVDLRNLARTRSFTEAELHHAAAAVAAHRHVDLAPTAPLLIGYGTVAQRKWAAWRRSQELSDACLELLDEQMVQVSAFIDPVLAGQLLAGATWDPDAYRWVGNDEGSD